MKAYTTEKQTPRKQACSYPRGKDRGYYVQYLGIADREDYKEYWITMLHIWDQHDIINSLHFN